MYIDIEELNTLSKAEPEWSEKQLTICVQCFSPREVG
jgi:hypothetical protein